MPVTQGTAARRRRLRIELRAERDRTGLTQDQVAEAMDWSQSKLIRIESGAVGISTNDLRALLALYNVTDPGRIEMITNLAKAFRERAWWEEYRDVVSKENQTFIGLEAEAGTMRYFQPLLIPGVLQTEGYVRGLLASTSLVDLDDERVDRIWQVRQRRQSGVLDRPEPPFLLVVLDEAALRRTVGGAEVMQEQVRHLVRLSKQPHIIIRVIPFDIGGHPGMRGGYTLIELTDSSEDDLLYVEAAAGDVSYRGNSDEVRSYKRAFEILWESSLRPEESVEFMAQIADSMV